LLCGHDFEGGTWDEHYINVDFVNGKHNGVVKAVTERFGNVESREDMWFYEKEST